MNENLPAPVLLPIILMVLILIGTIYLNVYHGGGVEFVP